MPLDEENEKIVDATCTDVAPAIRADERGKTPSQLAALSVFSTCHLPTLQLGFLRFLLL